MGIVYRKEIDQFTSFAVWKIEESAEELVGRLQLKEHERSFLNSLAKDKRNLHWLSTRVLLRNMLTTDEYIDCQVDENGKPYLTNFPHQISLSHSFDYAAVMISRNRAVGIDIELVKDKIERIARKFMSEEELAFIGENRIEQLYVCWCAKEAIYKLHGKKNVSFLNHIRIAPFKYPADESFAATLDTGSIVRTFKVGHVRFEDYMIGYVADDLHDK